MLHRIREAMKVGPLAAALSGTIVADETWIGGKLSNRHGYKRGQGGQGRTARRPFSRWSTLEPVRSAAE